MKTMSYILACFTILFLGSCETLNQYGGQVISQYGNPSQAEMSSGIKQALEFGTNYSADRLATPNGYFNNLAVKILWPEEAQKIERTIRTIGLNKLADDVVLSVNRAAEQAAIEAKPIFLSAIRQMTLRDASNILLGSQQDAATEYFKRVTSEQLRAKFNPIIQANLEKAGATRHWATAINAYNRIPLVTKVNPDLDDYVTQKAIDGLFHEIAQEELKIRTNAASRSTTLLQKVFGWADKNRGAAAGY